MCYICENKNSAGEPALCKNWQFNSVALLYKNHGNILCFICEDNTFWQQEIILPHMKRFFPFFQVEICSELYLALKMCICYLDGGRKKK